MASGLRAGSRAATDFTAGEMALLGTLIARPRTLNRHSLSREFCWGIGWPKPDSGLKDIDERGGNADRPPRAEGDKTDASSSSISIGIPGAWDVHAHDTPRGRS